MFSFEFGAAAFWEGRSLTPSLSGVKHNNYLLLCRWGIKDKTVLMMVRNSTCISLLTSLGALLVHDAVAAFTASNRVARSHLVLVVALCKFVKIDH